MKKEKLVQKIASLNNELDTLARSLQDYSHEALNKPPKAEAWSAIQVLYHVYLSEKYSLAYCQKKLSFQPKLKEAGLSSWLKARFVQFYLNSPLKFKAPKAIASSALPDEGHLDEIIQNWKDERKNLQTFMEQLPAEYLNKEIYKHPFGGRLSLEGMLDFMGAHFNNHRKQIWRSLK